QSITTNDQSWIWSEQLGLWIGKWTGTHFGLDATWLRFYDAQGQLVFLEAEEELRRAESAEAEVARLKEILTQKGISPS
ncbi:MAG TPA: hypothetical protein VGX70_19190, partial [Gemmataceae bacterium]|nr:hypothetical protein [Gemmataceae bacterium]